MHPSEEIYCEKSSKMRGKTILLGITGSIAATECFAVIRELVRNGATVVPVMTQAAMTMVTPLSLEFACGTPPITELTGRTEHITWLADGSADAFIIYPATANTISKIANGIDDTPVTSMATVALGNGIPIAVAPAMHDAMYRNPAVQENVARLKGWGVSFIGPHIDGPRAKAATRDEVVAWASRMVSKDDLQGKRILVIGGRSEEPIDSMRVITNRSTGLMAVKLAERAFERGADVELWMGGCSVPLPSHIPVKRFETVSQLIGMTSGIEHDLVIVPAALADFSPRSVMDGKISSEADYDMTLKPVPKVLPKIKERCARVIGFKAESGLTRAELVRRARERMTLYGLMAVVANDIDSAGKTSTSAIIVTEDKDKDIAGTKTDLANSILDLCSRR